MIKEYILPIKVLAKSKCVGEENLFVKHTDMASFNCDYPTVIQPNGYILLDFGKEYNGGVRIICQDMQGKKNALIRLRFGESAMECMSEIGFKNATNDHSVRDQELFLPWVGILEYGHTGFRFLRIDNCDEVAISLMQVECAYEHSGKQVLGAFRSSDEKLNKIWDIGVRTIYLNNMDLITDGIKRDRLVWIGDMHPESSSILRLFGYDKSICNSLDYIKNITPPTEWMNGIASYTMWWIKILYDLYLYTGDKEYLEKQLPYLKECIVTLGNVIKDDGSCDVDFKFIDWPSGSDPIACDCGVYAMMSIALKSGIEIFNLFGEMEKVEYCKERLKTLQKFKPSHNGNKQIGSLLAFANEITDKEINDSLLSVNPLKGISTFLCYYVLIARANAGDMVGALDLITNYYGAMMELGATTFWEDFDYDWAKGAKPLDSLLEEKEYDVHGDNGICCYIGYRHSLCHGWSAGFIAFLSEYVLGVKIKDGDPSKVEISPNIGKLEWVEGSVPTVNGIIKVKIRNNENGLKIDYEAPAGVTVTVKS